MRDLTRHFTYRRRKWCCGLGSTIGLAALCLAGSAAAGSIPALPQPISNNAVAVIGDPQRFRLYSFFGLAAGKQWNDVSREAFEFDSQRGQWRRLPVPPVADGRLASVAAVAAGRIYLFGGYTVAADGSEVSTPEVWRFDPALDQYQPMAAMPLPVDDSVALVYRDRWILLLSGWHDNANVSAVQVYDSKADQWSRGTDYPGTPVFGHAGALLEDRLLVCDGVKLSVSAEGERSFSASDECWLGQILDSEPQRLRWQRTSPHPGPPRYRMAARADASTAQLVFAGGSPRPYNYDGIGYDGHAAEASARVDGFDLKDNRWQSLADLSSPSMDHRGLPCVDRHCYLIGGMNAEQQVTPRVLHYQLQADGRAASATSPAD